MPLALRLSDAYNAVWRNWAEVCGGGPYYAHDILPWYLQYLQMKGMTGHTEASSRHLSSQLKKYPRFIMRVRDEPRRAGGQRFVLEGHPTFQ